MKDEYRVIQVIEHSSTGTERYYSIDVFSKWDQIYNTRKHKQILEKKYPYDKFKIQEKRLTLTDGISYITELKERKKRDRETARRNKITNDEMAEKRKNNKIIDEMRKENPNW